MRAIVAISWACLILPSVREFLGAITGRLLGRRTREMELRIPGMASGHPIART